MTDYQKRNWEVGSRWNVVLDVKSNISRVNQAGFNAEAWAFSQGIDGYAVVKAGRRKIHAPSHFLSLITNSTEQIRSYYIHRIEKFKKHFPNGAALVSSLALGYRKDFSLKNKEAFKKLGLSHLISISGLHIGIVAFLMNILLLSFLKWMIRLRIIATLPNNTLIYISIFSFFGALLYAFLSGFSVPTQRSLMMLAVIFYAILTKRYLSPWQIWWLGMTFVLIYHPMSVLAVGFWLSFLLVASLLLLTYVVEYNRFKRYGINFLRAEYATTIASILLTGIFFYRIPVIGFLANLVAIPWFSFVITPLSIVGILLPSDYLFIGILFLSEYTMLVTQYFSNFSMMAIIAKLPVSLIGLGGLAAIILILPKGLGLKIWASTIFLSIFIFQPKKPPFNEVRIHIFDVGQGIAILVETQKHRLLYDTGQVNVLEDLKSNLYAKGIISLDTLILSQHTAKHDSNWREIQRSFKIPVIMAGEPKFYSSEGGLKITDCKAGRAWNWDGIRFEFLTPDFGNKKVAKSDKSCVLKMVNQGKTLLIIGNLSNNGKLKLMQQYQKQLFSDILILRGLGTNDSLNASFLENINPTFIIASLGYQSSTHSFAHEKKLLELKRKQIKLFRTDFDGAIEVYMNQHILVEPQIKYKPFWQKKPI